MKTVKLASLAADLAKEREGDWVSAPDIAPGIQFHVRSTFYPPFCTARDQGREKLNRKFPEGIPEEDNAKFLGTLAIQYLLLDWSGFDQPFSADVASEILTDEAYRKVRWSVYLAASRVGQRELEFVEEAEKN